MMKHYNSPHGLWTFLFAATFLLLLSFSFGSFAQRTDSFEQGKLRIKVSEQLALQLEHASLKANASKIVLTGIQSIDNISQQYKVNAISRVFRPAGKFEARHRRYGLHLWYEIQMDKAASVLDALGAFKQVSLIEKTEPVFKKAIIGSENKNYGPRIIPTPIPSPTLSGAANDPFLGSQWHYNNTGQTGGTPGADIKLFQAWAIQTGRPEVIVAVTDGGIQINHPDLTANIWVNTDEIPGNNIDDDGNGYIDDINGYGFGDNTGTIAPDQHGTHVGGTIAATTNNGIGVAGIAGGSGTGDGARLMSCAAFGANNSGGFAETYVYGADNGAVISQNSWGYTSPGVFEQAVLDGIDYFIAEAGKDNNGNQTGPMKGGIVIFAAGNDDNNSQHYPGFYAPTLAVSGSNHMDKKAWYSNFGDWVDIDAPGGETNTVSQQGVLSTLSNNQYGFFQGTSMATPHVSGVAALIVSAFGGAGLTPDMVRGRLVQTTDNINAVNPGFEGLLGSGRLNAFAALQQNDHVAPDSITDLATIASTITSVSLVWTSPVDPGNGSASAYDIRYSIIPITEANFDSATAVVNPPSPSIAGQHDSLTVTGLAPGTAYYFAIKAVDFFGNVSALSNVVQRSTQFPPIISVTPTLVSDTLQTAESSTRSITISNTGQGPLTYLITNDEDSFVHPVPAFDTIPLGQSRNITLALSANNLLAGDYNSRLIILSDDPIHDSTFVDVALHVINNGLPIATISPDSSIYFGGVFVGGTLSRNIYIHNSGSETLRTWQTGIDGADFSSNLLDTLYIAPFRDTVVNVRFTASALGVSNGAIHLVTNDPLHAVADITLTGEGLDAPAIVVSPDSLVESLHTGRTATQQLTIQNTGGSDLQFSIKVKPKTTTALLTKEITLASYQVSASSANLKQNDVRSKHAGTLQIKSVSQSGVVTHVLIVTPDSNVDDLKSILNSFSDIQAKVFPVDSLPVISLANLTGYDIVMTTNNGQWQATGNVAPDVIGDLLADYIDQGGKVIVNQFAYSYDAWKMTGRFIEQQYGPFISSTADANIDVTLDSIATGNPIMQGVTTLDYSGFVQNVGLAPGATPLATWSNGDLFAAAKANVVALNILPSLGNGGALPWSGDLPTFYQNAIHWLSGPSFIKVSPSAGTVPAGTQANLDVLFDASSLAAGSYEASLDITNNVPSHELISIPAVLHVLGPEFSISPDSIAVTLGKDESTTQTIVVTNNGSDNQPFSVRIQSKNGAGASSVKLTSLKTGVTSAGRQQTPAVPKRDKAYNGPALNDGNQFIQASGLSAARKSVVQNTSVTYATDFESFNSGDIDGQQGWEGQFGNWTIDSSDPVSGTKHFHGLADGLGQSLSFSPIVSIGTETKSTTTMKINVQGSGVTWQVIPQSPSAGFLNTRVEFSPDGSARALVSDGAGGGGYLPINATVPGGYFDLTIEVDRDSATFDIFFNNDNVFHGLGFAGDIEQVVFLSLMEEAGPVLDVDDFQILDGARDTRPGYLTVSPVSGNIGAGESIALTATFNSTGLEFGKYRADIIVDISNLDELTVPTTLSVVGDPAIEVDPTVLQAVVGYKEDTIKNFQIRNTGGNDLFYGLTVIGASTDMAKLPPGPVNKFRVTQSDVKVQQKIKKDQSLSRASVKQHPAIELLSGSSLLEQGFDSLVFPPAGWSYTDNAGSGVVWNLASAWGEGNYSGVGNAATVSSDAFGAGEFDTELISPSINVGAYRNVVVQYSANYQNFANLDYLDLDIKVDGAGWVNVLRWNEDHGSFRGLPGEFVSLNLDTYLAGANSFKLRWHYYDPNSGDFDWYAQIDNVVVLGDPKAWLTVNPAAGIVPVGGKANIDAHFYSQDLDPGFYVAGILVNSNAVKNPLVGVVASLDVLNPAEIEVSPASVSQELFKGQTASQTVLISNHGESSLTFTIDGIAIQGAQNKPGKRIAALTKRTTPTVQRISLTDPAAIAREKKTSSTALYATGFEEFTTGDISGQGDWSAQFGNWTIEQINPYSGTQHFRGLSDGLGQSLAFSPQVAIGTEAISSATLRIDLSSASGATWQVIPQSPTAQFVNTRIQISPDGTIQALVADSLGNASFANIVSPVPAGYFDLKIEVVRATAVFSLYFNNIKVFEGQGFTGDIEELVILSLMESDGPVLDIDNLAILDGTPQAPWIVVNPTSGVVPANSSLPVTLFFDARDLAGGSYYDTLRIHSNDPIAASVNLPVYLHVTENLPPVLAVISDTTVVEGQTIDLTFTATDPDDSLVNVSLTTAASFITLKNKIGNSVTYTARPLLGNAGDYLLTVTASDGRGGIDSAQVYLNVLPYGVKNFSLINTSTNEVITTFDDSVTVDIAHPDYAKMTIRANTNPYKVGSVIFKVDGSKKNTENIAPYDLKKSVFNGLSIGSHTLYVDAFTKTNGKGVMGKGRGAIVNVSNLSTVTELDIVNTAGQVLKQLHNGDAINIGDAAYRHITIVANVGGSKVGSVVFELNGSRRVESIAPYALNGDKNGYYIPWSFTPGQYYLEASTYSKGSGKGVKGGTSSLWFWIVDTDSLATNAALRASLPAEESSLTERQGLSIYPVPVNDELQLTLGGTESIVEVQIINSTGQVFYKTGRLDNVKHLTISTTKIGLISGMYLVQTINNNGCREVKKFVKE